MQWTEWSIDYTYHRNLAETNDDNNDDDDDGDDYDDDNDNDDDDYDDNLNRQTGMNKSFLRVSLHPANNLAPPGILGRYVHITHPHRS
jgi:hypothetical protein